MSIGVEFSHSEQLNLIRKLEIFKIQGRDKRRRPILRVVGKFFLARSISVDAVKLYLEAEIFPILDGQPFSVLYIHTGVNRVENFPGITALKTIYDAVPTKIKEKFEAFYFLHAGLQSRLFLATFGRLLFSGAGLYGKVKYVNRLDLLWENVKRNEVEIPEFVWEFEEEMDRRPLMDYGLESDHPRSIYQNPSPLSTYSMRCIA